MAAARRGDPGRTRPPAANRPPASVSTWGVDVPATATLVLLAACVLAAVVTRALFLSLTLGHDEALTVLLYLEPGPRAMFTEYTPNDHLLFGLLTWLTTRVLPETAWVYRMWSVVPALAAIALSSWWMWRRRGAVAGLVVAVTLTASPLVMERTGQARGYGLAMLAMAVALIAAVRWQEGDSRRAPWWFAAGATVAFTTFPLTALPLAGHVLLLARDPAARRRLLSVLAPAVAVSAALFAPTAVDLWRSANDLVAGGGGSAPDYLITGPEADDSTADRSLPGRVLAEVSPAIPADLPIPLTLAVGAVVVAVTAMAAASWWRAERHVLLHAAVPGAFLVAGVTLALPYAPRFVLPAIVHMVVLLALAAAWLARRVRSSRARAVTGGLAVLLALVSLGAAVRVGFEAATSPARDYRAVAGLLDSVDADEVYTTSVEELPGLLYYVGPERLIVVSPGGRPGLPTEAERAVAARVVAPEEFEERLCRRTGVIAVIEKSTATRVVTPPCAAREPVLVLGPTRAKAEAHRAYVFPPPTGGRAAQRG